MKNILKETFEALSIIIVSICAVACLAIPIGMLFFQQFWWLLLIPVGIFLGSVQHHLIMKNLNNDKA